VVSVVVADDFEPLEDSDLIFTRDAIRRDFTILGLVGFGQWILFATLFGHLCLGMQRLQPWITAIWLAGASALLIA